jgi:DNA-binding transcriptional ArsR family regulator
MRLPTSHILDRIFSTWGHIAVLRHLFETRDPKTGRAIARAVGMTHRACLQSLSRLESMEIVSRMPEGRSHLFALNRGQRFVATVLPGLFEYERALMSSAAKIIRRELFHHAESVLFRYAEGRQTDGNPLMITLCVVVASQAQQDIVMRHLSSLGERLRNSLGIQLESVVLSEQEFRRQARRQLTPAIDFLADGVVLFGRTIRELLS